MAKKKRGNTRRKKPAIDPNNPPVCKFFREDKCRFGDDCKFSHDLPNATSTSTVGTTEKVVEVKNDEKTPVSEEATTTPSPQRSPPKKQSSGLISRSLNFIASSVSPRRSSFPALESSLSLFTPSQQELAKELCELPGSTNQSHLFENWSDDSEFDDKKREMMSKLESVDQSYPDGGLVGYLQNAVELLEKSRRGENPLEGWSPSVPQGETFEVGTEAFLSTEELGLKEVGKCGFVLVAGG